MSNPRKKHAAKTRYEKEAYTRMLKTQQREDPTFDEEESSSSNSIVKQETGKSSITDPQLKPYQKESNIPWKDIIIGTAITLVGGIILTILFLFGMSLNREIGVLQERTENTSKQIQELQNDVTKIEKNLTELDIKLRIMNDTNKEK